MQDYLSKGKELIKVLISNGFEAFFVGEAVRNTILDIDYSRVDIVTNAKIDDIKRSLSVLNTESFCLSDLNVLEVRYKNYPFYFKTYQVNTTDKEVINNTIKHYSSSLIDDLSTKNFTINAIAMSYNGKITDAYEGCTDLKKKVIRTIVKPKHRFITSPIDILEALAIESELKFKIQSKTLKGMKAKSKLLNNANPTLIINTLDRILKGKYVRYALSDLIKTKAYKYIPFLTKALYKLAYSYKKVDAYQLLLMASVLNNRIDDSYDDIVSDKNEFRLTCECIHKYPKSKYDNYALYKYGLDLCILANYINYALGKVRVKDKKIKKEYNKLIIKSKAEIKYPESEIIRISNIKERSIIDEIYDIIAKEILNEELSNSFDAIQSRVVRLLNERGIYTDLSNKTIVNETNNNYKIDVINPNGTVTDYYDTLTDEEKEIDQALSNNTNTESNDKVKELQDKISEQERILEEKNLKLKQLEEERELNLTNKLVDNTMTNIDNSDIIKDKNKFRYEYLEFLKEYLRKQKEE